MKLKYYLRGLGMGIAVTAVIMGVSSGGSRAPMTDEQVKARAAQLGMIENTVLTDRETESEAASEEKNAEAEVQTEETVRPEEKLAESEGPEESVVTAHDYQPAESINSAENETSSEDVTQKTETEQTAESAGETKFKVITVRGGDGSYQISQRLQAEGLIEDAVEFDNYLCGSGYSSKLRSGDHKIPEGATEEEIAKLLTSG